MTNEEIAKQWSARYLAGEAGHVIAAAEGVSLSKVYKYLRHTGAFETKRKADEAARIERAEAYASRIREGESVKAIAESEDISHQAVYDFLKATPATASALWEQKHPPKPKAAPVNPGQRPHWTYPDQELLAIVHQARDEMQAVLSARAKSG